LQYPAGYRIMYLVEEGKPGAKATGALPEHSKRASRSGVSRRRRTRTSSTDKPDSEPVKTKLDRFQVDSGAGNDPAGYRYTTSREVPAFAD